MAKVVLSSSDLKAKVVKTSPALPLGAAPAPFLDGNGKEEGTKSSSSSSFSASFSAVAALASPTDRISQCLDKLAVLDTDKDAGQVLAGALAAAGAPTSYVESGAADALVTLVANAKAPPTSRVQACTALAAGFDHDGSTLGAIASFAFPALVDACTDKNADVKEAARRAAEACVPAMGSAGVSLNMDRLLKACGEQKWDVVEAAFRLLSLAGRTPACQLGVARHMVQITAAVISQLSSSHPKKAAAAAEGLDGAFNAIHHNETQQMKGNICESLATTGEVVFKCLEQLMETTFVNAIGRPTLAVIVPVISKGLKDRKRDLVWRSSKTIKNIFGLVRDWADVQFFAPVLLPEVEKAMQHSDPEVREMAEAAKVALTEGGQAAPDSEAAKTGGVTIEQCEQAAKSDAREALAAIGGSAAGTPLGDAAVTFGSEGASLEVERSARLYDGCVAESLVMSVGVAADALGSSEPGTALCASLIAKLESKGLSGKRLPYIYEEFVEDDEIPKAANFGKPGGDPRDFLINMPSVILAFAGKVLLGGTALRFQKNRCYGLVGRNGTGKTTMLNRIAARDIEGFPQDVSCYYVAHEIFGEGEETILEFMRSTRDAVGRAVGAECNADDDCHAALTEVGFDQQLRLKNVSELSGGWRMKLAIAKSMMYKPELLLMDEPTNHLDIASLDWLSKYVVARRADTTVAVVSHDYNFLGDVLTDVVYLNEKRLEYYRMTFGDFQGRHPEIVDQLPSKDKAVAASAADSAAASGGMTRNESAASLGGSDGGMKPSASSVSLAASEGGASDAGDDGPKTYLDPSGMEIKPMCFPDPGKLDGVPSRTKPVLKVDNMKFAYPPKDPNDNNPENARWIFNGVNTKITMSTRVALLGKNGAGKTTLMKILIGELSVESSPFFSGDVWKHHNLRLSYIAQHSVHHLEGSVELTPVVYMQRRFHEGMDAELKKMVTHGLTPEEEELKMKKGNISKVVGRQQRGKELYYECEKTGRNNARGEPEPEFIPLYDLKMKDAYVMKLVRNFDERMKAEQSGMSIRPTTQVEVRKHLNDFGISPDLATQKIKSMSGGQKCRLVLAAAMWSMPHIVAFDEPTNYLDQDTLRALTDAIKAFKGGVIIISHHEGFVNETCKELWTVADGVVQTEAVKGKEKKLSKRQLEKLAKEKEKAEG